MKKSQILKQRRKRKKLNLLIAFLLVIITATLFTVNIFYNKTNYVVEFYGVQSERVGEQMRIVFVSDLHLREYGEDNADLLSDIKALCPDLVILGGDLVIQSTPEYGNMTDFCRKLAEISPVYGVWGNHEDTIMYNGENSTLRADFEATGVRFLTNESEKITLHGNDVAICGIDGSPDDFEKYGAKQAIEAFDGENADFKICVAHVPTYVTEHLQDYDFDIALSGHVHGGIINLPKFGAVYSAEEGFFPEYSGGEYALDNSATLIVSRGLGDSSSVPRINNIPELCVIDIY